MMTVAIPVEEGNAAYRDGSLGKLVGQFINDHKPEAAYFSTNEDGERAGIMILDLKEPSDMIRLAEPWFLDLNARVTFKPVMNAQDLAKEMSSERVGSRN